MRAYIPASLADLDVIASGKWEPAVAYGATEPLLAVVDADDPEEIAELVRDIAARASVVDLASPLRLVMVADLARAEVTPAPDLHIAAVRVSERIPRSAIACAFVDEPGAGALVKAALGGDEDALDALDLHDLLWFDASEIDHLPRG